MRRIEDLDVEECYLLLERTCQASRYYFSHRQPTPARVNLCHAREIMLRIDFLLTPARATLDLRTREMTVGSPGTTED